MLSRLATSLAKSLAMPLTMSLGLIAGLSPVAGFAAERPVVVELFTSQGCNSCPPANAYLNELSKQRRDVLALAFHVTYWDRLGWKDPFSLEAATQRQAPSQAHRSTESQSGGACTRWHRRRPVGHERVRRRQPRQP